MSERKGEVNEYRYTGWLASISSLFADESCKDPRVLAARITNLASEVTDGERAACILFEHAACITYATDSAHVVGQVVDLQKYPEILAAIDTQEVIFIEDARVDPRLDTVRWKLPPHLGSVVVIPIVDGRLVRGAIVVRSSSRTTQSPLVAETCRLLGTIAGRFLHGEEQIFRRANIHLEQVERSVTPVTGVEITPGRILIVEDDVDCREALVTLLTESGYTVVAVGTGGEALEIGPGLRPDVILLDVRLPDVVGYEVAQKFREDRRTEQSSIIFLSAVQNLAQDLLESGMSGADFLRKPFDVDDLLARVARGLREVSDNTSLRNLANTDQLTGLGNLRFLEERMAVEASRISRYGTPLSVLVVDMDNLKTVNDRYGHLAGSQAIRTVAGAIASEARRTDVAGRYGGDEFIILMPHSRLDEAARLADRIRERLRHQRPLGVTLTASMGLAAFDRRHDRTIEDTVARADAATYRAKAMGRDRLCVDKSDESTPTPLPLPPGASRTS